jgi:cytochrome c-type biogenesis protein CcsB
MLKPEAANQRPIFLIHHPELLRTLELEESGIDKSGLRYYTYDQVEPHLQQIQALGDEYGALDDKLRTPYQRQLLKLRNALVLYQRLQMSLEPPGTRNLAELLAAFQHAAPAGVAALSASESGKPYDTNTFLSFVGVANGFMQVANAAYPLVIPPPDPQAAPDQWVNFGAAVMNSVRDHKPNPTVEDLAAVAGAFQQGDPAAFNQAVDRYARWMGEKFPTETRKGRAEYFYNESRAFVHAMIIYLFAFLLATGALLTFAVAPNLAGALRRSAVYLIVLAFLVHTFGLVFRMMLEGRPPVTNLYSSAIFIGWGAVILGLALERFYKVGLGGAVAALTGFVTLIIAHNLALGGDTMEMLQAVLDTNFWLATHVTTVTIGYASTFVAGMLGIAYVLVGMFTPLLTQKVGGTAAGSVAAPGQVPLGKAMAKMIYAIVCFATLFSFVGTVLGGIWADQSWGRFWGWDPKENGALIIVLWNGLILHARWGGFARDRGMAVLSIFGNIVTSYSWFGVNMLGIGLHSYGFMDAAFKWLMLFVASQVGLILLGCLPLHWWKSFQRRPAPAVPEAKPASDRSRKPAAAGT